jgi:hypothetical protein
VRYPSGSDCGLGGGGNCTTGLGGKEGVKGEFIADRADVGEPSLGESVGLVEAEFDPPLLEKKPIVKGLITTTKSTRSEEEIDLHWMH